MQQRFHSPSRKHAAWKQGTALILVLAALVLISAIVVAFLALSSMGRLIAFSSAGQARAGWLAQSTVGIIEGDLRQEIIAGSKTNGNPLGAVYNTGGVSVYVPVTNATVVPQRVAPAVTLTNPNLVKVSWATNAFWSGGNYLANNVVPGLAAPVRSLAGNSTTASSLNQRSIPNSLWNQHYLLGVNTPSAANWQAPDWVILTASGAFDTNSAWVPASPTAANLIPILSNPNSTNRAVGRYAYAIYDEGGLIDINVAGNLLPSSQNTQRGRLNQIDLTQLYDSSSASPLISATGASTLLNWRSPVSGTNSSSVPGSGGLFDPQQTFLNAAVASATLSDQKFTTRQDLINYSAANPTVIPTQALQYLTTFSRDVNAPSWTPTVNGPAGGFYNYKANAESGTYTTSTASTVVNRDLANIRFSASGFIPPIGNGPAYIVTAGQPLLVQRFPLNRLSWIGLTGPANGATASDVYRAFGLTYVPANSTYNGLNVNPGTWIYTSPDSVTIANRIKSLSEVAALSTPRQPDFFELLQAGILSGSLGLSNQFDYPAAQQAYRTNTDTRDLDRSTSRQIVQIGVNLINQVQSDNWPRTILFNWFQDPALNPSITSSSGYTDPASYPYLSTIYPGIVGVTDMPYIYKIFNTYYKHPNIGGTNHNSNGSSVGMFNIVEMWNPHQPIFNYTSGPTSFRVRVESGTSVFDAVDSSGYPPEKASTPFIYDGTGTNSPTGGPQEIDFTTTTANDLTFRNPSILSSLNATMATTAWPGSFSGVLNPPTANVWMIPGSTISSLPWAPVSNNFGQQFRFDVSFFSNKPFPTYRVDYMDSNGKWSSYPYQLLPEFCFWQRDPGNGSSLAQTWYDNNNDSGAQGYLRAMFRPDPRGSRWGLTDCNAGKWALNQLVNSEAGSYTGRPTNHYYQQPESSGNNPGEAGGLFTSNNNGVVSNYTYFFNDLNNGIYAAAALSVFAFNPTGNDNHYVDFDGFCRTGDSMVEGAYQSGNRFSNANGANPNVGTSPDDLTLPITTPYPNPSNPAYPNSDPRPIILHRAFRTVGEMGYAYRDMPWKSLDFFSSQSPDAALLDLFTVNDSTVRAGTVDLNTRQLPVLQTLLQGSIQAEYQTNLISTAQAKSLASTMTNLTGGGYDSIGPIGNVSELSTRLMPHVTDYLVAPLIKTQNEAAVRTLAQVGNVRTWNLLVDLVVQSGRFPTNASNLNNFVVEGQRHYWLHLAIDRFTGKVIDHSLEPVSE